MKKLIFLGIALVTVLISTAQMPPDDDNDGIPNSEDLCPKTKGTKENKGCPGATKENTMSDFITPEAFETILNNVCFKDIVLKIDKEAPPQQNGPIATTLPKTGKNKNFPVYYETDGKGIFVTYVLLSDNTSDYQQAVNFIDANVKPQQDKAGCLMYRPVTKGQSVAGDSTFFSFNKATGKEDDYMEWIVYNHEVSPTNKYVVLAIKTIPYAIIDAAEKAQVKANSIYNAQFCNDINKILKESAAAFKNVRSKPQKGDPLFYDWVYNTTLPSLGFTEVKLGARKIYNPYDDDATAIMYDANTNFGQNKAGAETLFESLMKKNDGCLDYTARQITNEGGLAMGVLHISYKVQYEGKEKLINLSLTNKGSDIFLVSLTILDESAGFKKDD